MFGFLKPKPAPEGPVQFDLAIEVEQSAQAMYRLLDWADPSNAKRQLGHHVDDLGGSPRRFRLVMTEMPEHAFEMTMIGDVPGQAYAFETVVEPPVGRLERDEEHYSLEAIDDQRCNLRLTTVAVFRSGMTMREFEFELAMMSMACQRALIKLKLHAEEGVAAVRALEAKIG